MAKTADVYQSIWGDPWFVGLGVDEKLLYFWGITNEHSNLAGLYVVAGPLIQFETGLKPARFDKAIASLAEKGKMYFRPESGAVWVKGRTGRVRSKTSQIAKSIARAVEECPERDFQVAFIEKYGSNAWLSEALGDLALELDSCEPHPNLSEVPSQSHSQSQGLKEEKVSATTTAPDPNALPDGFPPHLAAVVNAVVPILHRTAEVKGAKPVTVLAVARAVEARPDRDHVKVASEVEHWCCFGKGENKQAKDIVARFRTFLDNSDTVVTRPSKPRYPEGFKP